MSAHDNKRHTPHSTETRDSAGRGLLIASGIGVAIGALFVCLVAGWCLREKLRRKHSNEDNTESSPFTKPGSDSMYPPSPPPSAVGMPVPPSYVPPSTRLNLQEFSCEEMNTATKGFSVLLGKGGYGPVYKAALADGTQAAVKRQMKTNGDKEFQTEIQLLGRLRHKKLVNLIGFCSDESEKMLVYEYKSKGSLSKILYGKRMKRRKQFLPWCKRVSILLDIAEGIDYLHNHANPPVIHRDIKSSNILLDDQYNAFIADFGIGKDGLKSSVIFGTGGQTTAVKGTAGYLDPDYFETKKLTKRSDVYSFGILMAELISGLNPAKSSTRVNVKVQSLNLDDREAIENFVDPCLAGEYEMTDLITLLKLSQHCTRTATARRPWIEEVLYVLRRQLSEEVGGIPIACGKHSESGGGEMEGGAKRASYSSGLAAGSDDGDNSSKSFSRRSINGIPDDSVSFDIKWRDVKVPIAGLSREYRFDVKGGDGDGADDSISFTTPHSGLLTLNGSSTNNNRTFEGLSNSERLSDNIRSFPWASSFRVKDETRVDTPTDQSDDPASGFHFAAVVPDVSGLSANPQKFPSQEVEMKHLREDQMNTSRDWEAEGRRLTPNHASRQNTHHSHHSHTVHLGEG